MFQCQNKPDVEKLNAIYSIYFRKYQKTETP